MNKSTFSVGDIYQLISGREAVIAELLENYRCIIRILGTNFTQKCSVHKLRYGRVKDKYLPTVYNKGIVGEGKYKVSVNGIHTKEYTLWSGILERVYVTCHNTRPSYLNVSLCDDWHNFQSFAEWCYAQPQFFITEQTWEIDKDIHKYSENSEAGIYSPKTCYLVPKELNNTFVIPNRGSRKYPAGVQPYKNKFRAELSMSGKSLKSPLFATAKEASNWYLCKKKEHIVSLAEKYKHQLHPDCYRRLLEIDLNPIEILK